MSDKIFLKDITLPIVETGEEETYSFVQTDSDLETAGDAADAKTVGDELTQLKADFTAMDGKIAATQITNTASGAIASFPDGADGVPVKDLTVQIVPVQAGTGDPSPENVRPITGWTVAKVARTGKNLYCGTKATGISIIYGGMNNAATVIDEDYTFKPGTYRLSFELEGTSNPSMFFSTKVNGVWSNPVNRGQVTTFTFTVPEHCEHLEIWAYGGTFTALKNIQIELGSATATAYEPSNGETVNVDWTTEAGTVYGGTLDVTSGVLTVDRKLVDLGDRNWSLLGNTGSRQAWVAYFSEIKPPANGSTPYDAISSEFKGVSYNASWLPGVFAPTAASSATGVAFCVESGKYADASEFKTAVTGVQFCYAIATPQTYQLTPTEVSTLLGQNNIWADCGDTTVDYRADTKLYIENLTAPTEDDMVANTNIPSDTYFMIGNTLLLSTTTIPAGDTINPGSNCTQMNLAAALNAINA